MRIITAIDVRVDLKIAQESQMRVRWDVAKRIDAGGLHLPVPHVAKNVGREEGWGKETDEPAGDGADQDDQESSTIRRPVEHHPDCDQVEQSLEHGDTAKADDEMMNLVHTLAAKGHHRES